MDLAADFGSSFRPPQRKRVLSAEDHAQMAELVKRMLERAGYEVTCVDDGAAAWQRIAREPLAFSAVVTDHQMPGLTGLQLVQRLRSIAFAGKIIVHSSALTPEEVAEFRRLRVDAILPKPARPAAFEEALR